MKKINVLTAAAVAGLFTVAAHAGNKAAPAADVKKALTEKECTDAKKQWKEGACVCAEAAAPAAPAKK